MPHELHLTSEKYWTWSPRRSGSSVGSHCLSVTRHPSWVFCWLFYRERWFCPWGLNKCGLTEMTSMHTCGDMLTPRPSVRFHLVLRGLPGVPSLRHLPAPSQATAGFPSDGSRGGHLLQLFGLLDELWDYFVSVPLTVFWKERSCLWICGAGRVCVFSLVSSSRNTNEPPFTQAFCGPRSGLE